MTQLEIGERDREMVEMEGEREDMEVKEASPTNLGLVDVNPKPRKGLTSKAVDWLEKVIVKLMYDSSTPQHFLAGNFAPVADETPPCKDLQVQGYLPGCLNGEFVRIGPNPKFAPVAGYHWFDGDGYPLNREVGAYIPMVSNMIGIIGFIAYALTFLLRVFLDTPSRVVSGNVFIHRGPPDPAVGGTDTGYCCCCCISS